MPERGKKKKEYSLTISGRLPSLNEMIEAERTNRYKAAKMKGAEEKKVMLAISQQMRGVKIENPCIVCFDWIERNRRRDVDNISGYGHKIILDSLVKSGILVDDSQKYVVGLVDNFGVDRNNPHILVRLQEKEYG